VKEDGYDKRIGPTLMNHLNLCDTCCDRIGVVKEVFKTGGCTCDACGFSFP
jgi:hypothetical protein